MSRSLPFWQSLAFAEPDQLVPLAKHCEELGFEGVLVSDHLFFPGELRSRYPYAEGGTPGFDATTPFPEPWAAISAMAAVTTRLRFATMIYVLPLRNPLEVAKSTATAAVLSGGRVALGAGAGWMREEYDTLGVPFEGRGRRYDESIEALRKLWRGGITRHDGDAFRFGPLAMSPAPPAPLPIWIGGLSKPALRRAARLGDGWLGTGQTPGEAEVLLARLGRLRAEAGRADLPFEAIVPLTVPPEPDALRRLRDAGATGTVSYPFVYALGPSSTLEAKRAYLEGFAEQVMARPLD